MNEKDCDSILKNMKLLVGQCPMRDIADTFHWKSSAADSVKSGLFLDALRTIATKSFHNQKHFNRLPMAITPIKGLFNCWANYFLPIVLGYSLNNKKAFKC
jgi:hypothetical protein